MTFSESVRTCLSKYVTIKGRAQRSEYWWFYLFNMLVISAFSVIGGVTGIALFSILGMVAMLGLLLPGICAAIRRLHDHDKSGWWIFIMLIPLIGAVLMLYWFATRGTVGTNQFGEDPLA